MRDATTGRFVSAHSASANIDNNIDTDGLDGVTEEMENMSISSTGGKKPSSKRNLALQKQCAAKYEGDNKVDASHYISVMEREHFDLANGNDNESNYRNQNQLTNRSVHTTIDNYLISQSSKHSIEGKSLMCEAGYIAPSEIKARIEMKIDVAKQTGDIYNARFQNYLRKCAEGYGVDMRVFNGVTKP